MNWKIGFWVAAVLTVLTSIAYWKRNKDVDTYSRASYKVGYEDGKEGRPKDFEGSIGEIVQELVKS